LPVDTYKIQIENIEKSSTDKSTKDLATTIVKLTRQADKLQRALERSAEIVKKTGEVDIAVVKRNEKRLALLEKAINNLQGALSKVSVVLKETPKAIEKAVSAGKIATEIAAGIKAAGVAGGAAATIKNAPEIIKHVKALTDALKRVKTSRAFETGRADVVNKLEKALTELKKKERSSQELSKSIGELSKAVGAKTKPVGRPTERMAPPVLFDKALKDMGAEFKDIKEKLGQKIVVAVDLETSEIKKVATEFGKKAAVEFISQIGFQKGTIADIMSGKAQKGQFLVKPPKGVTTEEQYKKLIGNIGKVEPIAFEKLQKEGMEATEAMKKLADVLKDAEVIIGQNIKGFDIHVLEQHFKKAGIEIDSAIDKLVDTLDLARKAFPKRMSHSLAKFEEDFRLAGVEIKSFGKGLHDATFDLDITATLLKAVDGSTKELAAAEGDLASKLNSIQKTVESSTSDFEELQKATRESAAKIADSADSFSTHIKDASIAAEHTTKSLNKAVIEIEDLAKLRSNIQANIFKGGQVIGPRPTADPFAFKAPAGAVKEEKAAAIFGDLAKSLDKLQNNIVNSLEKGMTKGMQILKTEAGEAFQLATGKGEFELKIVDVRGLRKAIASDFQQFVPKGGTAGELIDTFKQAFVQAQLSSFRTPEAMADALYREIGGLTSETAKEMGKAVGKLFKDIKEKTIAPADIITSQTDLTRLFSQVVLEARAEKKLMEDFVKRLAIPAISVGEQGLPAFKTKFGAERAVANFATINTGLERLAKEMQLLGAPAVELERMMREISKLPIRIPSGAGARTPAEELTAAKAEKLAAILVKRVIELGGETTVKGGLAKAVAMGRMERGTLTTEKAPEFIGATRSIKELLVEADVLKVSFLDVAKAMDTISFENFYDMLDRLFQAGKTPFIEKQAATIGRFTSSMRDISSVVNEVVGLMPLIEPGRVKRTAVDVESLRVLTRPTAKPLGPEQQTKHIVDAGLLWKDIVRRSERLGQPGIFEGKEFLGKPIASSLDVSDAASSVVKQLNLVNNNLKAIDKTMINMSTANLRATAPFKEFSSINRQLSNVANALKIGGGAGEIPSLVSAKERGMIESGKFGAGGFGFNVLTELRNTASTFEDQIVISGRLAKVFTEITQRLIKPAKVLLETGGRITEIEPGLQRVLPEARKRAEQGEESFQKVLGEVSGQFQDILGVPQRYRGRADIADIGKKIETVMREHRGKTAEVQSAALTEVFLNFFGRKFTTRFGTKGVSVTQQGDPELPKRIKSIEDVSTFIKRGFRAGVKPGPGLGVAEVPKSMGQLLSELMKAEGGMAGAAGLKMHDMLIESGNKFILEMFKDASKGLVTEEEALKQKKLFTDVSQVFKSMFDVELPSGVAGIKEIKDISKTRFGEEALTEFKPIEARISSRGIAKRGLMPEVLEAVVNNLIGSTTGVTTLSDDIKKGALLETKEARDSLREVMIELGFEPFKDLAGVIERIKFEKPSISQEEIDKLLEYEKAVAVYTEVVNEFGERVQSLVAPKFLQIVEEPHIFKEATPGEIEKGVKGLRLDFQSFAAMAGVFGEGSKMMQELAASTALASDQGWELIKTFQSLDPTMVGMRESMLKSLKSVKLEDITKFDEATGTIEQLKGTIFDIGKFPTAFKTQIPSTKPGPLKYEEFRVPGPSLRGTYQEELLGTQAPTGTGRYLANLISAAKSVEELADAARTRGAGLSEEFQRKFATTIRAELTKTLTDTIKTFQKLEKASTPQNIEFMERTIGKFKTALSPTRPAAGVYQEGSEAGELPSFEAFSKRFKGQYSKIFGRLSDILIGANPESLKREVDQINSALKAFREGATGDIPSRFRTPQLEVKAKRAGGFEPLLESFLRQTEKRTKAKTVFDIELEAGNLDEFAKNVGISIQQSIEEALQLRREALSKAKVRYFKELGKEVFGKKKGIEQVFFQRVTPAITGKAISAIADKTEDLNNLLEELGKEYVIDLKIPGIEGIVKNVKNLTELHSDFVEKAKRVGLPVLKPGEIGLPSEMLKKIQVRTGEKSEIALSLEELIKKEQDVFVQSVRFPFTGVSSIQPHIARIMEDLVKGPLGKFSIAVPGAPGFAKKEGQEGLIELTQTLDKLREFVGIKPLKELPEDTITLLKKREEEWAKGTEEGAMAAGKLTSAIEGLLKVIQRAIPTFTSMEQKLDFDGDALFIHTGQVQESRDEIKKHFEALGKDTTAVRTLFRSVFTAVKETDVAALSEMANIFSKKHPGTQGFEFLTKPFIQEDVKNLNIKEVLGALFDQPEAARGFVEKQVIPDVAKRVGATAAQREEFIKQARSSETGIPELGESADVVSKNMAKLTEELIRRQLWERKYADAISGQLFKIETGRTVEGISRLARISEMETGFGAGVAGTGKAFQPAPEFLKAFPKESMALGRDPVGEFAARVNEILRFVIQKGMDVKHAGVEAIGPQLLSRIGKSNVSEFVGKSLDDAKKGIDKNWEELSDFNDEITNQMKLRLGSLSTEELKKELQLFEPEAEVDISREALMERILSKVNIEATFEELFRMIQRAAIKGLSKNLQRQLEEGPLTPATVKLRRDVKAAGGVEQFAEIRIAKESISDTGIAISKHIVTNLQPLYKMRTSMETMATAADRTGIKIDPEQINLPAEGGDIFRRDLKTARKAAASLSTALAETGTVETGGVHKFLVLTAIQQRYKELEELQKLEKQAQGFAGAVTVPFSGILEANKLAAQVLREAGAPGEQPDPGKITEWLDQMASAQKAARTKVEDISKIAGLRPLIPEEEALIGAGFEEKQRGRIFGGVKGLLEREALVREEQIVPADIEQRAQEITDKIQKFAQFQLSTIEQLRRVSEIMATVPAQKEYLERAFPDIDFEKGAARTQAAEKEAITSQEDRIKAIEEWHKRSFPTARTKELEQVAKSFDIPDTAATVELKETTVGVADALTGAISEALVRRKRDALKYLESKAKGPELAKQVPLHEVFRASALKGGGAFGGGTQTEGILQEMLGLTKPSALLEVTGLRGTAVHRQKQKELLERFPKAEIEVPIEDFGNKITGHLDVVYEEAGQKIVADIKTIYSTAQFDRLRQISEEIEKEQTTVQEKLRELKAADPTGYLEKNIIRRLEDYLSQVNVYLKGVEGAVGKIIIVSTFDPRKEFTIDIGAFDPALFDKDIKEVEKSRRIVSNILGSLSVTGGLPPDLLKEYPKIYKELAKKLGAIGPEEFAKTLPTRPVGETPATSQEVLGRLTSKEEERFARMSKEYLDLFQALGGPGQGERQLKFLFAKGGAAAGAAGAPPVPPGGGGPGDGFDDEDEIKKRIEKIITRMQRGIEPEPREMVAIVKAIDDAQEIADAAKGKDGQEQVAANLEALIDSIERVIVQVGGDPESYRKIATTLKEYQAAIINPISAMKDYTADIERIQPSRPEAVHKNLRALYEAAIRINRLADSEEIQKFGPDIAGLLTEAAEKGPGIDISSRLSQAMGDLPVEKRGGLQKIWQFYKKSISEYFLRRLDALKKTIEQESGAPEGRQAFIEYEQVIEKFLANIRGTVGKMSDIFTTAGPSGKKTQFVDEELARLTGIYRSPKQIEELVKQTTVTGTPFKPILDMLTADLDAANIEDIAAPLEKVNAAFSALIAPKGKVQGIDLKEILMDAELFGRFGEEAVAKWDFDKLVQGITQLRAGLQSYNRLRISGFSGADYTEAVRVNVEETVKLLKQLEKAVVPSGGPGGSALGLINVPSNLDPGTQALLHRRNLAQIRKFFKTAEAAGGPERGQAFSLRQKVVDPATKQVLKDSIIHFRNIGQTANSTGQQIGLFTEKYDDMIASLQSRKGVGQAFKRVINWGIASRTVYGMVGALQDTINTMADVETGISKLRQVMSPLNTNFEELTKSALTFAKDFGLPIRQVIDAMRVFAQQGLAQEEVVDRTRTSMLAANVTTLSTTDATEAITAAMKVYRIEGQGTIRFLDSWSEVSAKHAVTSATLADALKKSAAVASTAGVTFDQLNGIITGIGETSRQTGKEIGTSLRFMFRRLTSQKAPEALQKIDIPVIGESNALRSGFDILGDLAAKWDELNSAQKLNIATAIGGRRHYNNLIILMDHWDDVLDTLEDSVNSKGAAERRNMIVMQTYAKRLQQVRESLSELQVQFGKFALPVAKVILTGLKGVIEVISNIPPGLKIAALGFSALFVLITKGSSLISSVVNRIKSFTGVFSDFGSEFMNQFKVGIFETFGKLPKALNTIDTRGLTTIGKAGQSIQDFESTIGKAAFTLAQFGRGWNVVMSEIAATGTATSETISKAFGAAAGGLGGLAVTTITKNPALAGILDIAATGAAASEGAFQKLGELFGVPAEALAMWSRENTNFVKSVAPLAGSLLALIPITGKIGDGLKKLAFSADQYEDSIAPLRRKLGDEISDIVELSRSYSKLDENIKKANQSREPQSIETALRRQEYVSPVFALEKDAKKARNLANLMAKTNIDLIQSFDEFGNAILKPTGNLEEYFKVLKSAKIEELAEAEVAALQKFAEELTNAGSASAKFRSELKKFVKEIPGIGPLLAEQIKVSPAQELKEAKDALNRILEARDKFPMTTAFDELFSRYYQNLEGIRKRYDEFYNDFKRILSELSTQGLTAEQIGGLLGSEGLEKGFQLMVDIEPRLRKAADVGIVDWEDVLGIEILRRIHPEISIDYAAPFTKELLREAKVIQRSTEAFVGDIVLFDKEIEKQFAVAGDQGILKYKEGLGYFVEVIDKELRSTKEIPFDSVKNFVDSIFPAHRIVEQLEVNLDILEESLTGAAAGMIGVADKEFKRTFNLGPRFFEQIPTTTLLQTPIGFNKQSGTFGPQKTKQDFPEIIREFFIAPQKELAMLTETAKKRLDADKSLGKGVQEEIERLSTIIKNNQVVVQYMAVMVDLNKTMAESSRILNENLAVEKARTEHLVETAGLLAGIPEGFDNLNLGIRNFFDLTAHQRVLLRERALPTEKREFTQGATEIREEGIRRQSLAVELEQVTKAMVQIQRIREQAKGAGAIVPRDMLMSITEAVESGGTTMDGLQLDAQRKTEGHTADTVERLDDMLSAMKDPKAQARTIGQVEKFSNQLSKDIVSLGSTMPETLKHQFDRLAKLRQLHEKARNVQVVKAIDQAMTESSRKLIETVGVRKAAEIIEPRKSLIPSPLDVVKSIGKALGPSTDVFRHLPGEFNLEDLLSRAMGGEGLRGFTQRLKQSAEGATESQVRNAKVMNALRFALPGGIGLLTPAVEPVSKFKGIVESPEFKNLSKLMNDQNKISVVSSQTLTKLFAAYGAFNDIARRAARREQRGFEVQIMQLREQRKGLTVKFKAGEIEKTDFVSQTRDINKQMIDLSKRMKEAGKTAETRATREAVGLIASATTTFARSAGFSESALNALGKTAAGSIVAWHAWSTLTGKEMPEAVNKATDALKNWSDGLGDEGVDWLERLKFGAGQLFGGGFGAAGAAGAAAGGVEDMAKAQKDILNEEEKDKIRKMKDLQVSEDQVSKADDLLKDIKAGDTKKLSEDEKMVGINQDQLTTLLSIEENTRRAADGSEESARESKAEPSEEKKPVAAITKTLRDKLDVLRQERLGGKGKDTATRIRDLITAATVVAAGGYLGEKTKLSAELGEATRKAEKISKSFETLVKKFPNEVDAMIKELKVKREEAAKAAAEGAPEPEVKSRLLDAEKQFQTFIGQLSLMADSIGTELKDSTSKIAKAADRAALELHKEQVSKSIDDFAKSIVDASIDLEASMRFSTETIGAMRGLPRFEEIPTGKLPHELTATERLMKEGGEQWQNMFKAFQIISKTRDGIVELIKENSKRIVTQQVSLAKEGSKAFIENQKKAVEKELAKIPKFKALGKRVFEQYKALPEDERKAQQEQTTRSLASFNKRTRDIRSQAKDFNTSMGFSEFEKLMKSRRSQLKRLKDTSRQITKWWREGQITPEVYSKAIPKINKRVIEVQQGVQRLEEFGEKSTLAQAVVVLAEKARDAAEVLKYEADLHKLLAADADKLTQSMAALQQILFTGLNIQQVIGDFKRLKESFKISEEQRGFQNLIEDVMSRLRGGAHPEAPVFPTFEMVQAGVPSGDLFGMNKAESRRAEIVAREGRAPTLAEEQRIAFDTMLQQKKLAQAREDDKLRDQLRLAANMDTALIEAQQRAFKIEDPTARQTQIDALQELRDALRERVRTAGERAGEIEPGVFRRKGLAPLEDIGEGAQKIFETISKATGDLAKSFEDTIQKISVFQSPVVKELNDANQYLQAIRDNTAAKPGILSRIKTSVFGKVDETGAAPKAKQEGGSIVGPGGPTTDSVPILASTGEYVVKASSVSKLGTPVMNYINSTGNLPTMAASGGKVLAENKFIKQQLASGASMKEIQAELGGVKRDPLLDPTGLVAGGLGSFALSGALSSIIKSFAGKGLGRIGKTLLLRLGLAGTREGSIRAVGATLESQQSSRVTQGKTPTSIVGHRGFAGGLIPSFQKGGLTEAKKKHLDEIALEQRARRSKELRERQPIKPVPMSEKDSVWDYLRFLFTGEVGKFQGGIIQSFKNGGQPDLIETERGIAAHINKINKLSKEAESSGDYSKLRIYNAKYNLEEALKREKEAKKQKGPEVQKVLETIRKPKRPGLLEFMLKTFRNIGQEITGTTDKKQLGGIIQPFQEGGVVALPEYKNAHRYLTAEDPGKTPVWTPNVAKFITSNIRSRGFEAAADALNEATTWKAFYNSMLDVTGNAEDPEARFNKILNIPLPVDPERHKGAIRRNQQQLKNILEQLDKKEGGLISSYEQGTPFVPSNQLAYLHKGEAIVPSEFNTGGLIGLPKFALGGDVSPGKVLKEMESAGEKIGEAVVKKIEETSIDLNIPNESDLPELKVNLDGVQEALNNLNITGVGAVGTTTIDQFIEAANEKFDRLEELSISNTEQINIIDIKASVIDDLKTSMGDLEEQLAFTIRDINTKLVNERSYVDTQINKSLSDFKNVEINPIRTQIQMIELQISGLSNRIEDDHTFTLANINRLDLGVV